MAYATVTDLEERWRELTAQEQELAATLLDDASAMIDALVTVDAESQAAILKVVTCDMVKRAMVAASAQTFGVEQMQATMGPFAQNVHFANPSGDLYLTKMEKRMLGISGKGKGRILYPAIGGDYAQLPDAI